MATKKISLGLDADDFNIENIVVNNANSYPAITSGQIVTTLNINEFAVAALQSLDWNAIGTSPDEAAKLAWRMAEAMVRNQP